MWQLGSKWDPTHSRGDQPKSKGHPREANQEWTLLQVDI